VNTTRAFTVLPCCHGLWFGHNCFTRWFWHTWRGNKTLLRSLILPPVRRSSHCSLSIACVVGIHRLILFGVVVARRCSTSLEMQAFQRFICGACYNLTIVGRKLLLRLLLYMLWCLVARLEPRLTTFKLDSSGRNGPHFFWRRWWIFCHRPLSRKASITNYYWRSCLSRNLWWIHRPNMRSLD